MKVDIQSLGTFNRLAHEGAEQATRSMCRMTGLDARVDVTKITLVDRADVGEQLGDGEYVGVTFGFDGEIAGDTVLVFDREGSRTIADALVPDAAADGRDGMVRSSVAEVGNVMMSGFIDGWADYLETAIEHTPPEYVDGVGDELLADLADGRGAVDGEQDAVDGEQDDEDDRADGDRAESSDGPTGPGRFDQVFVFKSEIEWVGESVSFYIYMLPAYGPLADVMAGHGDAGRDAIPVDKLQVFNEMTRDGTRRAAENVELMTGIATEAEVTQLSFAPVEDVPKQVGTDVYVGTVVEFTGVPSGFLVVLFDEASAVRVAEAMMPVAPGDEIIDEVTDGGGSDGDGTNSDGTDGDGPADEFTDRHRSAVEELGNIVTSGFVDGWANVLQTSVDHTPPRFVHDMGRAILDPLAAQVGRHQEHAFIIDSEMRTEEVAFSAEIHALPSEKELRQALGDLLVDRADQTEADVEEIFE